MRREYVSSLKEESKTKSHQDDLSKKSKERNINRNPIKDQYVSEIVLPTEYRRMLKRKSDLSVGIQLEFRRHSSVLNRGTLIGIVN